MPRPASVLSLTPTSEPSHPARKLVETILLMAIKYRATRLRLELMAAAYRVTMIVNEAEYELIPPPGFLADRIARLFRVLAEMDISKQHVEQSTRLHLAVGTGRAETTVTVGSNEYGSVVDVEFRSNTIAGEDAVAVLAAYGMENEDGSIQFTEDDA